MKLQDTGLGIPWIHLFTLPEDVQCVQGHVTHMEQINEFWSCLGSKPGEKKRCPWGWLKGYVKCS